MISRLDLLEAKLPREEEEVVEVHQKVYQGEEGEGEELLRISRHQFCWISFSSRFYITRKIIDIPGAPLAGGGGGGGGTR